MHAYFDEFVHSRSTLKMFMEQYDMAMGNKIQKEFIADFQLKNKVVKCVSTFYWEKQFQQVYTHSIFKLVQEQINRMIYCQVIPSEEVSNETGVDVIKVFERSIVNNYFWKEYTYSVRWSEIGEHISCNCRKFEFRGILCCHIMVVLAQKNIQTANERYVLRRWRKYVNRRHSNIFFAGGYPHMTEEYKKFQEVGKYFQQCIELAMCSSEKLEFIKEKCNEMKDALVNWVPTTSDNIPPSQTTQNTEDFGGTPILNPVVTATRGRPRNTRYISRAEERSRGRGRRARGRGVGRSRVQGRSGGCGSNGHGDGMATQGNEEERDGTQENEGAFTFDLNEDVEFCAQF
ncbi:hypothetical protein ACS0TY_012446 [Phlomoides rotata]